MYNFLTLQQYPSFRPEITPKYEPEITVCYSRKRPSPGIKNSINVIKAVGKFKRRQTRRKILDSEFGENNSLKRGGSKNSNEDDDCRSKISGKS